MQDNIKTRHSVRVFAFKNDQVMCIEYKGKNQGYLDIPGGKIEKHESAEEACRREFMEETGMTIDKLLYVGKIEILYPNQKRRFIMKTYLAQKIEGTPKEFSENYAYWIPLDALRINKKRFASTHLLDKEFINYLKSQKFNIIFICDEKHNLIDTKINSD